MIRRALLTLLWHVLDFAFQDVKREQSGSKMVGNAILPDIRNRSQTRESKGNLSARTKTDREPLKNITNTVTTGKANRTAHGIFRGILEEEREEQILFKKSDLLWLMSSKHLFELIYLHIENSRHDLADRKQVQNFIELLVQIALSKLYRRLSLEFKNRELYDSLALKVTNAHIFEPFMRELHHHPVELSDYKGVARILELCACHQQGIAILNVRTIIPG